jgi:hypothetical protein
MAKRAKRTEIYDGQIPFDAKGMQSSSRNTYTVYIGGTRREPDEQWLERNIVPYIGTYGKDRGKPFYHYGDDYRKALTDGRLEQVQTGPVMKDNFVFEATIKVVTSYGIALDFEVVDCPNGELAKGAELSMFRTDFMKMIPLVTLTQGEVTGHWTFRKQGYKYGVRYLTPEQVANA